MFSFFLIILYTTYLWELINLWREECVCVFKHFMCVYNHTCNFFSSDWWTICRINQEKALTHIGGEILKVTSFLEVPPLPSVLPSSAISSSKGPGKSRAIIAFLMGALRTPLHKECLRLWDMYRIEVAGKERGEINPPGCMGRWGVDLSC